MKKRTFLSLFAAFWLFVSLFSPALATETETTEPPITTEAQLEASLIQACRYGEKADIAAYDLTVQALDTLFHRLYNEGKLPWYVKNGYSYEYREWGGENYALAFTPELFEESFDRMLYEQKLQELLQSCSLDALDDWQKALVLHDQLILRCRYDETLLKNTGYDLLINGTTVCAGYASLYQDLLQRIGIPSVVVVSDGMDHAWNLVQLDGSWYHVDVTWDDPTPDLTGRVRHIYFLRTDEEMRTAERPHYGWETDISCTDDRFSDGFWSEVTTQVVFLDQSTCYYGKAAENLITLYCRDIPKATEKHIYKEPDNFLNLGQGKRRYYHMGLSYAEGRLWVCTMDKILSMATDGKDKRTEFTYDAEANRKYILGFQLQGAALLLQLSDHGDNVTYRTETLPLKAPSHSHSYALRTVTPSCATEGYTLAVCDCGLEAKGEFVKPQPHDWQENERKPATFWTSGYIKRSCKLCGKTEHLLQSQQGISSWLRLNWKYLTISILGVILLWNLIHLIFPQKTNR